MKNLYSLSYGISLICLILLLLRRFLADTGLFGDDLLFLISAVNCAAHFIDYKENKSQKQLWICAAWLVFSLIFLYMHILTLKKY